MLGTQSQQPGGPHLHAAPWQTCNVAPYAPGRLFALWGQQVSIQAWEWAGCKPACRAGSRFCPIGLCGRHTGYQYRRT